METKRSASDILKSLTFGVKRSHHNVKEAKVVSELRMRIIPEDGDAKKPKMEDHASDSDSNEPLLFSNSGNKAAVRTKVSAKETVEDDKVTNLRKANRMYTWGTDIPDPFIDFSDLDLPEQFLKTLKDAKIEEPSPIQMQSISVMLAGREILASAPTGSGKTLAFVIPVMMAVLKKKEGKNNKLVAIILEPTRILAKQTYSNFVKFTANLGIKLQLLEDDKIEEGTDVLITTPNRFIYAMKNYENEILSELEWLIVDESDRLFETTEGDRDFRSQLAEIYKLCDAHSVKHGFFSATFSGCVETWCKENLTDVITVCIGCRNTSNINVKQELVFAGTEQGKISTMKSMLRGGFNGPAIVFVQSKDRAGQLCIELKSSFKEITISLITSDVPDNEKETILDKFKKGAISMLICTEMLGRGLDVEGINLVINYDLPVSIINYIHRVGRTGRAGKSGKAITYFTEDDIARIRPIATVIHQAGYHVPEYTLTLKKPSRKARKDLKKIAPRRKDIGSVDKWKKVKKVLTKKK